MFESDEINKIDEGLKILGIYDIEDDVNKEALLNEISLYIFETQNKKSTEPIFDLELDYKYYFPDFFGKGINLNTDEISWWEFNSLLEAFFLNKKSTISTVLGYRTYKKPSSNIKTQENEQHRFYLAMKRQYALPRKNNDSNGIEKLWGYIEKKVKNKE